MWSPAIPKRAAQLFFVIIVLQVPLFRVPCRSGTCTTPLQITATQLVAGKVFPPVVVKAILYPGACFQSLTTRFSLPAWGNLLQEYNLINLTSKEHTELNRLEVVAGSYFTVAGSLITLVKPGRMSLFGVLLLVWGLVREGLFDSSVKRSPVYMSPIMLFAVACAFLSVKYDVQKVQRLTRPVARPLKSSSKSKFN